MKMVIIVTKTMYFYIGEKHRHAYVDSALVMEQGENRWHIAKDSPTGFDLLVGGCGQPPCRPAESTAAAHTLLPFAPLLLNYY